MGNQQVSQARTVESMSGKCGSTSGKSLLPSRGPLHPVLELQQTIGNQAVQRMLASRAIQPMPSIGQPHDIHERETDRVAEQVMRMPAPALRPSGDACVFGGTPCPRCKENTQEPVQRNSEFSSNTAEASVSDNFLQGLGPGEPLDASARAFFEPRFGYEFGSVRVHTDAHAADSARSVHALAYTVGHDVVFGSGQYAPQTPAGRQLIAHELTHVVQQRGSVGCTEFPSTFRTPHGTREQPHDHAATHLLTAARLGITPIASRLQRYSHSNCADADLRAHVWPADHIAKQMVAKAIRVLRAKPADPAVTPLLSKYFMSATPDIPTILAGYNAIQGDFTGNAYTYECEDECDSCAYVRARLRYIGISPNIHLCMNHLRGQSNTCIGYTIVHEFGHYSAHFDDEAYCHAGCCGFAACPATLSQDDALDNADSYGAFAYELFPLGI